MPAAHADGFVRNGAHGTPVSAAGNDIVAFGMQAANQPPRRLVVLRVNQVTRSTKNHHLLSHGLEEQTQCNFDALVVLQAV